MFEVGLLELGRGWCWGQKKVKIYLDFVAPLKPPKHHFGHFDDKDVRVTYMCPGIRSSSEHNLFRHRRILYV